MMRRFGRSRKHEQAPSGEGMASEQGPEKLGGDLNADLNSDLNSDLNLGRSDEVTATQTCAPEKFNAEQDNAEKCEENDVENSEHNESEIIQSAAEVELAAAREEHETQLETLRAEVRENYDKYLRSVAELENVKKRAMKERADLLKYGGESLARDLLDVVDALELAIGREYPGANDELLKGVKLVLDLFGSVFERHMIRSESSVGQQFDPEKHQAMTSVPTTEHPHNSVMQEYRKAYFFKDRLLRPGQVVVATNPQPTSSGDEGQSSTGSAVDESAGEGLVDDGSGRPGSGTRH